MDRRGHQEINECLRYALGDGDPLVAKVVPRPDEGEDVRFVTVTTSDTMAPALVLNALWDANLMNQPQHNNGFWPKLEPRSIQPGSLTFEDLNTRDWSAPETPTP